MSTLATETGPLGPVTTMSLTPMVEASTVFSSLYVTVTRYPLGPGTAFRSPAAIEVVGPVPSSERSNPFDLAPTPLPVASVTDPARTLTEYEPLSLASHDPPGAATV